MMDGLLLDNLLEGIAKSEIFISIRSDSGSTRGIIEENLIGIGTDPANPNNQLAIVRSSSVLKTKTFNNQSTAGVFLGCYNGTTQDGDLVTDVEAALIGI